jgi:hypothetical protein
MTETAEKASTNRKLADWLAGLDVVDQNLLTLSMLGFTQEKIAQAMGCSTSRVCSRLKARGRELAERAGIAITKKAPKQRTAGVPAVLASSGTREVEAPDRPDRLGRWEAQSSLLGASPRGGASKFVFHKLRPKGEDIALRQSRPPASALADDGGTCVSSVGGSPSQEEMARRGSQRSGWRVSQRSFFGLPEK